jgi:hypothetical protein
LEQQRRINKEEEDRSGRQLNFEAPWTVLAAISEPYRTFVQGEIERMGADHPTILTQYKLQTVTGAGRLFPQRLLDRMQGQHARQAEPSADTRYVMGIDVAGRVEDPTSLDRDSFVLNDRDETVITVAETRQTDNGNATSEIRVVEVYRWRGVTHAEQFDRILRLLRDVWHPARITVDATGVGAGLASFLHRAMPTRIDPVMFTAATKSKLGFAMLSAAETGRLTIFQHDHSESSGELWRQLRATRYKLGPSEEMSFSVPASEGHDDFVISLALAIRAAEDSGLPSMGGIVRAPSDLEGGW